MRIWSLGEILKTEHLGHERYVRDEECREALQEKILEILEQGKKIERLRNISNEINDYDPGILNDYGGGKIDWWMDYMRSEIDRCNNYWRQALGEE